MYFDLLDRKHGVCSERERESVCERGREGERERESVRLCVCVCARGVRGLCVCVHLVLAAPGVSSS